MQVITYDWRCGQNQTPTTAQNTTSDTDSILSRGYGMREIVGAVATSAITLGAISVISVL